MKIEQQSITIRELVAGFKDDGEGGVVGFDGKLDIRPAYQREFVYKDAQRSAVIDTITKGFPLNVMYFADRGDGTYEVMDGQQRTISICQYVASVFSRDFRYFHNLAQDEKDQILDYELLVYFCSGGESEKLDWFRTINIAGEKLTDQELRNAVYHGPWLTAAKKWFSRTGGPATQVGIDYVKGSAIRQELLELALGWVVTRDGLRSVDEYMSEHQLDQNANDLWMYYQEVLSWAKLAYPKVRKYLTAVDWGKLYHEYGALPFDGATLEVEVARLMQDEDVTRKPGIYEYLFSGRERHLSIRAFSQKDKGEAFERQGGVCPICGEEFELGQMQADHIVPWSLGGATVSANCQMLCVQCNNDKGDGS